MTRFARAKGSKSSNERAPEDSTPWEVMKEQLMQSKKEKDEAGKRQEAENQRITNYENFLKEQKVSKRKATWCDFPEENAKKRLLPLRNPADDKQQAIPYNGEIESVDATQQEKSKKKEKKKGKMTLKTKTCETATVQAEAITSETETPQNLKKNKKKHKKKQNVNGSNDAPTTIETKVEQTVQKHKKKNKNKQNPNGIENLPGEENYQESNSPDEKSSPNKDNTRANKGADNKKNNKKKVKMINGKPTRRKEINDKSFQLIINSKEVELVRFDGFPIMKKDAERLTELRKSMIQKGIPKSEVQRTMKLERRRAEKALARVKREVCYNCRKGGHNLSNCPELKSKIPGVDAAEGICFKCGSTEHRQFECKVQRDNEFRFATCFICREQGHLARQCPDNPKGLYPNGGSCKLCGDVTHLRKDCPTTQGQREETSLKLDTLGNADSIEDIGQQAKATNSAVMKKQPKKIKF